jgi:hypothetical protein
MKNYCVNPNSKEFKAILERVKNPLLAEIEYLKTYQEEGENYLPDSTEPVEVQMSFVEKYKRRASCIRCR